MESRHICALSFKQSSLTPARSVYLDLKSGRRLCFPNCLRQLAQRGQMACLVASFMRRTVWSQSWVGWNRASSLAANEWFLVGLPLGCLGEVVRSETFLKTFHFVLRRSQCPASQESVLIRGRRWADLQPPVFPKCQYLLNYLGRVAQQRESRWLTRFPRKFVSKGTP